MVSAGATAIVVGGIGGRPLMGFQQMGITVYAGTAGATVAELAQAVADGKLTPIRMDQVCGGGGAH